MGNKSKQHNIKARRKLAALYERGVEVRFGPNGPQRGPFESPVGEDGVAIWIAPPSPLQREAALREAQAKRARATLAAKSEDTSIDAVTVKAFVSNMDDDALVDYVLQIDEAERQEEAQREVLSRDEWDDFPSLQDAMRQWDDAGNPRTDEWEPLIQRDLDYGRQVREEANRIRGDAYESLRLLPREELETRARDKRIELIGTQSFLTTYEEWMLFYGCRDPEDRQELFFADVDDLKEQDEEVQEFLANTLAEHIQDPREAKNSQGAASGSESSESPDAQEISEASTPEAATA